MTFYTIYHTMNSELSEVERKKRLPEQQELRLQITRLDETAVGYAHCCAMGNQMGTFPPCKLQERRNGRTG